MLQNRAKYILAECEKIEIVKKGVIVFECGIEGYACNKSQII